MAASIRFTKITNVGHESIKLAYQEKGILGQWDNFTMECQEEARPAFYKTLSDLAPHCVSLCELPAEYENRVQIHGVALSYDDDSGIMAASIIGTMGFLLSKGCLDLKSPAKAEKKNSDIVDVTGKGGDLLPEKARQLIQKLIAEAKIYKNGERLQADLPLDGKSAASGEKKE